MVEAEAKLEEKREIRISKLAWICYLCGIISLLGQIYTAIFLMLDVRPPPGLLWVGIITPAIFIVAVLSGVGALIHILISEGFRIGYKEVVTGILLSFFCSMFAVMPVLSMIKTQGAIIAHQRRLSGLYDVIQQYGHEKGKYPRPNKWCDSLIIYDANLTRSSFQCFKSYEQETRYAINPHAKPNSPPNIVLLFESKRFRNQFGGVELMNFDNLYNKDGCNVLFNDGHVEFIEPEEVGKLKWRDEQK
jgi:prepilin-type processing-associated H-X9-DG protein